MTDILSAGEAAAHAARLSHASFIPFGHSPLGSSMRRVLANNAMTEFSSHSAAMNAAMAAASVGRRVFVPVSVQSVDGFYSASFQRLPIVAANISRSLWTHSARNDLNDVAALRDAGWVIFLAETVQEMLDGILMAYKISEDQKVMLPSIVNMNGFDIRETVDVPSDRKMAGFFSPSKPQKLDFKKAQAFNPPVDDYMEFTAQQQKSMENALAVAEKISVKWKEKFGRSYAPAESFMMDDADYAFVVAGFNAGTCRETVRKLREQGEKAGMLRIRMLRPFHAAAVLEALKNVKKTAVVDESISLGASGILHAEIRHGFACNFIAGLGRRLTEKDFGDIFSHLKKAETPERMWLL